MNRIGVAAWKKGKGRNIKESQTSSLDVGIPRSPVRLKVLKKELRTSHDRKKGGLDRRVAFGKLGKITIGKRQNADCRPWDCGG